MVTLYRLADADGVGVYMTGRAGAMQPGNHGPCGGRPGPCDEGDAALDFWQKTRAARFAFASPEQMLKWFPVLLDVEYMMEHEYHCDLYVYPVHVLDPDAYHITPCQAMFDPARADVGGGIPVLEFLEAHSAL